MGGSLLECSRLLDGPSSRKTEPILAKNQNTSEKRRREYDKKRKAEEKRQRREARKDNPGSAENDGYGRFDDASDEVPPGADGEAN